VDNSDILRFIPTSTGPNTAGTFEWYFDGSDVELAASGENVDAVARLADGRLALSTTAGFSVTGASGQDEDLFVFAPTNLGSATGGSWSLYFDGSDVGLSNTNDEDVWGAWIDEANSDIYLTTVGAFAVTGVSGDGADIFVCKYGSLGATTTCTYRMYWDGSANGFAGERVDAFAVER
jgi:hypothetical protein